MRALTACIFGHFKLLALHATLFVDCSNLVASIVDSIVVWEELVSTRFFMTLSHRPKTMANAFALWSLHWTSCFKNRLHCLPKMALSLLVAFVPSGQVSSVGVDSLPPNTNCQILFPQTLPKHAAMALVVVMWSLASPTSHSWFLGFARLNCQKHGCLCCRQHRQQHRFPTGSWLKFPFLASIMIHTPNVPPWPMARRKVHRLVQIHCIVFSSNNELKKDSILLNKLFDIAMW